MTKKQRRLREKRKAEIRSKQLKRIEQRMNVKYGKYWKAKAGLEEFVKKYHSLVLASIPICSSALMLGMASRWIRTTEARIAELTNRYNELCEREKALLEGS